MTSSRVADALRVVRRRGDHDESEHTVDAVLCAADGAAVRAWGDPDRLVMARSAIKSIQALPLVASGAADALEVTDDELALACSSHSGSARHVAAVAAWLARIGSSDGLECGPDLPLGVEDRAQWLAAGTTAARIANCCSGKHAGFLTVAAHRGVDPAGYLDADHPVMAEVIAAVAAAVGVDPREAPWGSDGCGIPTMALPLPAQASAMARLVSAQLGDPALDDAARRIVAAHLGRAWWVAGDGRPEVFIETHAHEPIVAKGGADGVFFAGLVDRGLGLALKVRSGSDLAAEHAIVHLLGELGAIDASGWTATFTNKDGGPAGRFEIR